MTKFKKGQTVFYASTYFATNDRDFYAAMRAGANIAHVIECRVISRVVDSCGVKQMTFADRGHDSVFGRSTYANNAQYFAAADEAFAYLLQYKASRETAAQQFVIYPTSVGDDTWVPTSIPTNTTR